MTIGDLYPAYIDKIIVYVENGDGEYRDLYKGTIKDAPDNIKTMTIRTIIAKRKDVLDIHVRKDN